MEELCGMLRVKIEDDADLALARTVLEDPNYICYVIIYYSILYIS